MISIPPEYLPQLADLNIQDPADCRWKNLDPWSTKHIRSRYFCPCRGPALGSLLKVDLESTRLGGRLIYIGQCPACRTIYWRDAIPEAR